MGPGVDAKFDELLASLGKIAQKHGKPVVDSVMRWRKSQTERGDSVSIDSHSIYLDRPKSRMNHSFDATALFTERRSLASIYIMCRALVIITESLHKDSLTDAEANVLEGIIFDQFRRPDVKLLALSENYRLNAELHAKLLGNLANIR